VATVKKLTKQQLKEHKAMLMGLGGASVVKAIIKQRLEVDIRASAVSNWMVRGIPSDWRPCLARVANEQNVAVPRLFLDPGKLPPPTSPEVPYL
jgi:hypothetical protein